MLLHNVLICGLLLIGLLSLAEARRVCKDHSRHCRQIGDKRPRFRCYRKSTQERCCATCRNFENPNNPDCLYGDKLAWCSSIGNRYSAVSCYTHEVECCETCGKLASDEIKDCPYGDREIWCPYFTKERCKDQASRSSCCETCHHLLHGDTVNTHGDKEVTEKSTAPSTSTELTSPSSVTETDQNVTSATTNASRPETRTSVNPASHPTSIAASKVTENHTDATGPIIHPNGASATAGVTANTLSSTSATSITTTVTSPTSKLNQTDTSRHPTMTSTPNPPSTSNTTSFRSPGTNTGGVQSTVLPLGGASSTVAAPGGTANSSATTARTLSGDNNTRDVTSSSPTVTYKTGAGPSSSERSVTSSVSTPTRSPPVPSTGAATTSPPLVTELRIRLQETPSPSTGSNGTRMTGGHSSYLPSLEDDEDYAQASGDDDITIDDVTEERPRGGGGHHHDGDRHHNGNHHGGGHHHKKGHHKNGVTAEVPYRYLPAEREDYIFEDFRSSSCRLAAGWSGILVQGLLFTLAIFGVCWQRWLT